MFINHFEHELNYKFCNFNDKIMSQILSEIFWSIFPTAYVFKQMIFHNFDRLCSTRLQFVIFAFFVVILCNLYINCGCGGL